jgi:hypothetical protein
VISESSPGVAVSLKVEVMLLPMLSIGAGLCTVFCAHDHSDV